MGISEKMKQAAAAVSGLDAEEMAELFGLVPGLAQAAPTGELTYRDYVHDAKWASDYPSYQKKFAREPRESDKQLIRLIQEAVGSRLAAGEQLSLLDLGCSTGLFLHHLRQALPGLTLHGADIVEGFIAACRENPDLAGIGFTVMNMLDAPAGPAFDAVTTNAATPHFTPEEYRLALRNLFTLLRPGGSYLAFDWFHPYLQEVAITEHSRLFVRGQKIHFRSYRAVRSALEEAGFERVEFRPFRIPIDLPRAEDPGDLVTHTVRTAEGERLNFRGTLFQPWCHLVAHKPAA